MDPTLFGVNYFSIILLVTMFFVTRIKKDFSTFSSKLLTWIIVMNLIGLVIEPLTWFFDGKSGGMIHVLSYASNFINVLVGPILVGLWASYMDYKLFKDKKRVQRFHYYQFPTYIIFMLLLLNFRFPVFFQFSEDYYYIRGDYHLLRYALTYILFFRLFHLIITNRKKENSHVLIGIILFMLVPGIGAIIQLIYPNILSTWSSLALIVVVVYIFLETTPGTKDYLTKLYSRQVVEDYLNLLIENQYHFILMMIDLDRFKAINDTYGHHVGDQVLIEFSKCFSTGEIKNLFASRLGGDEFLIIIKDVDEQQGFIYIEDLRTRFKEELFFKQFPSLDFSAGCIAYDYHMTVDDLLTQADNRMYERKKIYKEIT
jgi:diguanylate cyclase (GGDEF)-like protein